ncbi:MAG: single-stranded DNA-binding protein [bacterium]
MASLNRVILMGNLTRDPELRYTQGGAPVSRFSIAVNRVYTTNTGEKKEEVSFLPIVVWGKQAESCNQYLNKGRLVLVDGRLRQHSWESKEGEKRNTIEVIAYRVQFLGAKGESQETSAASLESENIPDEIEDEIPF